MSWKTKYMFGEEVHPNSIAAQIWHDPTLRRKLADGDSEALAYERAMGHWGTLGCIGVPYAVAQ